MKQVILNLFMVLYLIFESKKKKLYVKNIQCKFFYRTFPIFDFFYFLRIQFYK